jgi:hypothetical protein
MQVFLGDRVTLVKNESYITGAVTGAEWEREEDGMD